LRYRELRDSGETVEEIGQRLSAWERARLDRVCLHVTGKSIFGKMGSGVGPFDAEG